MYFTSSTSGPSFLESTPVSTGQRYTNPHSIWRNSRHNWLLSNNVLDLFSLLGTSPVTWSLPSIPLESHSDLATIHSPREPFWPSYQWPTYVATNESHSCQNSTPPNTMPSYRHHYHSYMPYTVLNSFLTKFSFNGIVQTMFITWGTVVFCITHLPFAPSPQTQDRHQSTCNRWRTDYVIGTWHSSIENVWQYHMDHLQASYACIHACNIFVLISTSITRCHLTFTQQQT